MAMKSLTQTVSGHVVQNVKVQKTNSRVEQARFADPSFSTASRLASGQPNTDRRRYVVNLNRGQK